MTTTQRATRAGGLAVLLAAGIAAPYVFTAYTVRLLTLVLISTLLASSINLLTQAGLVSVGHAALASAAGYGLAYATDHGRSWPVALLTAAGVACVVAGIFAVTSMRTSGIYFLMVTLALGMIVFGLAYRLNSVTNGENGITGVDRPALVSDYWQFYFLCLVVLVVALVALWVINRSPFGLTLRGIRDSESRMRSLGYNVTAHKFFAVLLSGAFAATAGVLGTWYSEFVSPATANFLRSALGVIMVILGGAGTLLGPLAGAGIVVAAENVLSSYTERWGTILGLVFIAVVLFFPQGLAGIATQAAKRLPGAKPSQPPPSEPPPSEPPESARGATPPTTKISSEPPGRR